MTEALLLPLLLLSTPSGSGPDAGDGPPLVVVTSDSTWETAAGTGSYRVDGVAVEEGDGGRALLFWIAPPPPEAVPGLVLSGASESRSLTLVRATGSWVTGVLEVELRRGPETSSFRALRTWLLDGTVMDLGSVVQMDSLFYRSLASQLGVPPGVEVDGWLWRRGFWLDPLSFSLLPPDSAGRGGGGTALRLGLPSNSGEDTMLTVDIPLEGLNTASGAMLD